MSVLYKNKTNKDPFQIPDNTQPKNTSSFVSGGQRFHHRFEQSPGPGSYEFQSKNFKSPEYHIAKDRSQSSPVKKQYQWIWGSDRTSYLNNKNGSLGPGSYEISKTITKQKGKWGKSNRFNNEYMLKNNVGPGSYENNVSSKANAISSVFKSKSPKSFIEKLVSESSLSNLNKNSSRQQIDPLIENPETSQTKQITKVIEKKPLRNSVFASKIPRFNEPKDNGNNIVGPGSYEPVSNQKAKESLPKIISMRNQQRNITKKIDKPMPGPGQYDIDQKTIQKSIQFKGNNLISKEQRFHEKTLLNEPGPGHYMQNKYTYMVDLKKKLSPEKPSFNSSSQRANMELMNKSNPFGNYNVDIFDMEYRLKKKQQHIEKLKIMQVSLPAFNTKAKK